MTSAPPDERTAGYQRRSAAKALAKRPNVPPARRYGERHARLAQTRSAEEQAATLNGKINGLSMKREAEVLAAWKEESAKRSKPGNGP